MRAVDTAKLSLRQIIRNRRRYKGVILGIGLGIAGLVCVLSMGDALENDLCDNLEMLADARILVATWDDRSTDRMHIGQYSYRDVEALKSIPGARSVSPAVTGWNYVTLGRKRRTARLTGIDPTFFETMHIRLSHGRYLSDEDNQARSSVCVIGQSIAKSFFPEIKDALDKRIFVGGHMFTIVGTTGGVEYHVLDNSVFVPINVARSRFPNMYDIREIFIRAVNWDVVPELRDAVRGTLAASRPGYSESIMVRAAMDRIEKINEAVFVVKGLVYTSLVMTVLLGGVGIANVMLAAVRERTTEIGLKKALGATDKMIRRQFLLESVTVSLAGVIIGTVIGTVTVELMKDMFETKPDYAVLAFGLVFSAVFGAMLGILAGIVPAGRAASLDPVDAMRFE